MTAPTVYLAGPYSQPDPVENTNATLKVADRLLAAGLVPYVPHLTLAWHLVSPRPYAEWLAYDRHWVRICDLFLRLPGESSGADSEEAYARELGKPVLYDVGALLSYARFNGLVKS